MSQTKAINRVFPLTSHPNKITSINRLSYEWLDSVRDRRRELEGRRGTSSSIFPMIKADPNCFDNIKDFVTGSRRAVRGADRSWRLRVAGTVEERGWCVTSRNRNSSETSRILFLIEHVFLSQVQWRVWPPSSWSYPLSSYKLVVCCRLYREHQVATQHSFVCYIKLSSHVITMNFIGPTFCKIIFIV